MGNQRFQVNTTSSNQGDGKRIIAGLMRVIMQVQQQMHVISYTIAEGSLVCKLFNSKQVYVDSYIWIAHPNLRKSFKVEPNSNTDISTWTNVPPAFAT